MEGNSKDGCVGHACIQCRSKAYHQQKNVRKLSLGLVFKCLLVGNTWAGSRTEVKWRCRLVEGCHLSSPPLAAGGAGGTFTAGSETRNLPVKCSCYVD